MNTQIQELRIQCPRCQQRLKFPNSYQGQRVICPKCQQKILVSTPSRPAATQLQTNVPGSRPVPSQAPQTTRQKATILATPTPPQSQPTPVRRRSRRLGIFLGFAGLFVLVVGSVAGMAFFAEDSNKDTDTKKTDEKLSIIEAQEKLKKEQEKLLAEKKAAEEKALAEAKVQKDALEKAKLELEQKKQKLEAEAKKMEQKKQEAERKAREKKIAFEKAQAKLEEQKQKLLEEKRKAELAAAKKKQEFEALQKFTSAELQTYRNKIGNGANLGRSLLSATHPTGLYDNTQFPSIILSADSKVITVRISVNWRGAVLNSRYVTTFRYTVTKLTGYTRLVVERDTAIIRIAAPNLQAADNGLRKFHGQ